MPATSVPLVSLILGRNNPQTQVNVNSSSTKVLYDDKENDNGNTATVAKLRQNLPQKKSPSYEEEVMETTLAEGNVSILYNLKNAGDFFKSFTESKIRDVRLEQKRTSALYAGSKFSGHQRSGRNSYDVQVQIKHVNLEDSFLCGFLQIKGLTDEFPSLSTYFEAEVIGKKHHFLTRKWDATESEDRLHWSKFASFLPYEEKFNDDDFSYDELEGKDHIFMRWKGLLDEAIYSVEHFLVHDHKLTSLNGASYAGFYYICFDSASQTFEGYYYHQNSEWFQHLLLTHVPEKYSSSFEFR